MPTHILALPAKEVVRLLRAENESTHGQPELDVSAWREYVIREEFPRRAFGIRDGEEYDLVNRVSFLNIEPRVERDYWVLRVVIEQVPELCAIGDEARLERGELTLDEFDAELRSPGRRRLTVRLDAETAAAKEHFDLWLADLRARHPLATNGGSAKEERETAEKMPLAEGGWTYHAREAVGVFSSAEALEAAVDELEISGFDRAAISVLGADTKATDGVKNFYRSVTQISDDSRAPRQAFISHEARVIGQTLAVEMPFYIGGVAGAVAVVAAGGALAPAVAAMIAGGLVGGGLGALLATAIGRHHAAHIEAQLARGGIVLWVSVPNRNAETRALAILTKAGASHVHVHDIEGDWTKRDTPFADAQPDPFLERDR